ncbi:thiamine-phosphate kinase [Methanosarcinales archaeon ex4572_44]|nr:MAG: thiamine-phosphate kinase [Methanosarcinales archaeon ex4572_44]
MQVFELGERAIVERIRKLLGNPDIGDDCGFIRIGDEILVATSDMLHQKTDFPPQMSGYQIGWMSAAVSLSDLAAMGAKPTGMLFAIGLPGDTETGFLDEIIRGIKTCADHASTRVIGGDLDAHDELTIVGTAIGSVKRENIMYRSGARENDLVCVTGSLGGAGAALFALKQGIKCPADLLAKLFEPTPRIREGSTLAESKAVTSAMDISDGLAASLHELSRANENIGFKIYAEKIPTHPKISQILKPKEALKVALYEGGDFELLFTVPKEKIKILHEEIDLTIIGKVTKKNILIEETTIEGKTCVKPLNEKGYEHLRHRPQTRSRPQDPITDTNTKFDITKY